MNKTKNIIIKKIIKAHNFIRFDSDVAKAIGYNKATLSQALNESFGKPFSGPNEDFTSAIRWLPGRKLVSGSGLSLYQIIWGLFVIV